MLYLGIDHGPQHVRAVVFSLETNGIVSEAMRPGPGGSGAMLILDPAAMFRVIDECVGECLQRLGTDRGRLAGLAVAAQPTGFALLSRDHQVVHPERLPSRVELEAAAGALRRRFGGTPGVLEVLGQPLPGNSLAVYLSWLKQAEPRVLEEVAHVRGAPALVNGWLTGTTTAELSGASETGLMDVRRRQWSSTMLEEIEPRLAEWLPPLRPSTEPPGGLQREIARRWGVPDDILVAAGGSRVAMELLGAGGCNPGEVQVNLAEAGGIHLVLDRPLVDPKGKLSLRCDGCGQWTLSLDRCESARLSGEVMEQWGWDRGQFERVAGLVEPGAGGLVFLGGRDGGTLAGIGGGNLTSPNLARAATEAVALELGRALTRMRELGGKPARARIVGLAGDGEARRRMLADVLGVPVGSAHPVASPAVGAALHAAVAFYAASGENLSFTEITEYALAIRDDEWSQPGETRAQIYQQLAARQEKLEMLMHGAIS